MGAPVEGSQVAGRRRGFKVAGNYEPRRAGAAKRKTAAQSARTEPQRAATKRAAVKHTAPQHKTAAQPTHKTAAQPTRKALPFKPRITTPEAAAASSFAQLGLGPNLLRTLAQLGASDPFPIQVATVPDIIAGRDLLGKAETGSGKTIAFAAGLVERLLRLKALDGETKPPQTRARRGVREQPAKGAARKPRAVILAPTRELALQIDRTVQPLARAIGFYTAQLVGGMPFAPQLHALNRGIDIVIGTPGRIRDLVQREKLDLSRVRISVIDEADHLCELGFLAETQWILRHTAAAGQRLLFSATLDGEVNELASEFLRQPAMHEVLAAPRRVNHRVYLVLREDKAAAALHFAQLPGRVLLFCRTRAAAAAVTAQLQAAGVKARALHGDLSQARREYNLQSFQTGRVRVLVATDIAARGIHVDGVDAVVQLDPPADAKTFIHRSGRCGRAGAAGLVVTLLPRTWQQRIGAILDESGITPEFFGDFTPNSR